MTFYRNIINITSKHEMDIEHHTSEIMRVTSKLITTEPFLCKYNEKQRTFIKLSIEIKPLAEVVNFLPDNYS